MLVFNGGIQIRVAWWIGQAHNHIVKHQDGDGVGAASSMCSVRRKKTMKNNTSIFGAMGIGKLTRSTLDDRTCIAGYQPGVGEGAEKLSDAEKLDTAFKVGMLLCLQLLWPTTATPHSTHPRKRDDHKQEPHRLAVVRLHQQRRIILHPS